jgi:hypothetical protein
VECACTFYEHSFIHSWSHGRSDSLTWKKSIITLELLENSFSHVSSLWSVSIYFIHSQLDFQNIPEFPALQKFFLCASLSLSILSLPLLIYITHSYLSRFISLLFVYVLVRFIDRIDDGDGMKIEKKARWTWLECLIASSTHK